jgi:hypothetical protein
MVISGDYVYLANGYYGLTVLDISDPQQFGEVTRRPFVNLVNILIEGNTLFALDKISDLPEIYVLYLIDVSKPRDPVIIRKVDIQGLSSIKQCEGNKLYYEIHGIKDTIILADNSDLFARLWTWVAPLPFGLGGSSSILAKRDTVYIGTGLDIKGMGKLYIYTGVPHNIQKRGEATAPNDIGGLCLKGNTLFCTAGYSGLFIFDVSDIDKPKMIGQCSIPGWSILQAVDNNLAFITTGKSLVVVDVTYYDKPRIIATYDEFLSPGNVIIKDGIMYITDGEQGVFALELVRDM